MFFAKGTYLYYRPKHFRVFSPSFCLHYLHNGLICLVICIRVLYASIVNLYSFFRHFIINKSVKKIFYGIISFIFKGIKFLIYKSLLKKLFMIAKTFLDFSRKIFLDFSTFAPRHIRPLCK